MTEKMIIVCNGDEGKNIMPTLIFAASGLALDYEVHIFFAPAGAKWTLKGEIEKLGTPKGMPNPLKLFDDIMEMGANVTLCVLAIEAKDIDPKNVRDSRIKIQEAPPFLMQAEGAQMSYVF